MIRTGKIDLAWSYILSFENDANPFFERKYTIAKWKDLSKVNIIENNAILYKAIDVAKRGIKSKDALHIACAIEMKCDYFLTTDDLLQKKIRNSNEIKVFNPIEFIKIIEEL